MLTAVKQFYFWLLMKCCHETLLEKDNYNVIRNLCHLVSNQFPELQLVNNKGFLMSQLLLIQLLVTQSLHLQFI